MLIRRFSVVAACAFFAVFTTPRFAASQVTESADHRFQTSSINGVQVAENTGGPKFSGDIFAFIEVFRLQQDPSKPDSYLSSPHKFTRDQDGYYYLAERGDVQVKVFDPQGRFVRSFGQRGEGPGDFESIRLISVDAGIVTLMDDLLARATFYRTNGKLEEVVSLRYLPRTVVEAIYRLPDSKYALIGRRERETENIRHYQGLLAVTTTAFDTLVTLETEENAAVRIITLGYRRRTQMIPYAGVPGAAFIPNTGFLVSNGRDAILRRVTLDGKITRRIEILDPLPEVSGEERRRFLGKIEAEIVDARDQSTRSHFAKFKDELEFPSRKGFSRGLVVDDRGYIWVEKPETTYELQDRGGPAFRVFSLEGEYLGETRWPGLAGWLHRREGTIKEGRLYTFVQDSETDEVWAVVFDIKSNAASIEYLQVEHK